MANIVVNKINSIIAPIIEFMGYELVGTKILAQGKTSMIRVYIDKTNSGVNIEDCSKVGKKIKYLLEVEKIFNSSFTLEVSSPGVDRPLFFINHFKKFVGKEIKLKLNKKKNDKSNYVGTIESVDLSTEQFTLISDNQPIKFELNEINKANLIYK